MEIPFTTLLTIDYGKSFSDMIAGGSFGWVNGEVTENHFPISGTGLVECEAGLVRFGGPISSPQAEREIQAADPRRPWKAARTEHMLALAAHHPLEQTKSPIAGLDAVINIHGKRGVLILYGGGGKRNIRVDGWDGDWPDVFAFLVVRRKD